ncbi:OmpA family protein [Seonamhaeicola marinus]|uniref:OmpA family protein n=1 Tax=Seonamhaeicola marinus TaxID=1912246 RepID=UPI0029394991|nr:OmpA family protein [Seonamhaeicola marinus]
MFYELGSARITPASKKTIDNTLLPLLNSKPVSIELMSHTDSRGNDDFNMSLSQQRANSVVNYLVSKGISRSRLIAKGYGETRLVNRCSNGVDCSETEHKKNRRTEFRVISN